VRTVTIAPEPMNGTDAALWDIERDPALRTTVVSVLVLDRPVVDDDLLASIDAASRIVPRLRQVVVEPPGGIGPPSWVLDEAVDVSDHVAFVELGGGGSFDEVLDIAADKATAPFDRRRPLWELTSVGGLGDGRAAVVIKIHHSFTDGVGGVALLDAFLDASREAPSRALDELPELRSAASGSDPLAAVGDVVGRAISTPVDLTRTALDTARDPARVVTRTVAGARSAVRLLAPSGGALSPAFGDRGEGRRLAVHDVPLVRIHDAASRHGCTINHLLIAGVIDGTSADHRDLGTPARELRVTMPVSFRRPDDERGGNQWAPLRFRVPADDRDPVELMMTVREITERSRKEPALGFSHALAGAIQILPSALSAGVVGGMMRGVDLVVTNVPGLSEPRYLAGAHVERLYPFAPTGGAAFNVALMSHEDTACIGVLTDTSAVGDPDQLHAAISAGIDRVLEVAERTPPQRAVVRTAVDRRPQRLTSLDTSFLRVETPESPMHIGGVFRLDGEQLRDSDGALRLGDIRQHVAARLARAPRFLRRLVEVPFGQGRPLWIEDPDFDIAHHVKVAAADAPGQEEELFEVACQLNMEVLDRSRPLWELWFIDHLEDGSVGILQKVHHALIDGVASVDFVATLFDVEPIPGADVAVRLPTTEPPSRTQLVADAWVDRLSDPGGTLRASARRLTAAPTSFVGQVGQLVAAGFNVVGPGSRAPSTSLNQPVGRHREVRSIDLDFEDIGQVRASSGATANDVALAVLAGGLRSWFEGHDEPLDELHAMCPVNVRGEGAEHEAGNHAGAMLIPLPIAEPDAVRRLEMIRERTARAKGRHEGEGVAALLDAVDHVPPVVPGVVGAALRSFVAHQPFVNLVITNVPGPRSPLWFMGARAESMVPIVPLGPNTALGVALLSYVDRLTIGLHADPTRCPDLDNLASAIENEMARLLDGG